MSKLGTAAIILVVLAGYAIWQGNTEEGRRLAEWSKALDDCREAERDELRSIEERRMMRATCDKIEANRPR